MTNVKQMKFTRKSELTTSVTTGVPSMVLQMSLSFLCAQKCILGYGKTMESIIKHALCIKFCYKFMDRVLLLWPRIDTGYVPFMYFVATIRRGAAGLMRI